MKDVTMMAMRPIDGFEAWKTEVKREYEEDPNHLFAILLYSKANKNLFDFVHKHYFTLDDLTGSHFTVFVVWYMLLKDSVAGPVAFEDFSDKITTYNLVRHFGFKTQKVPCLVFFKNVDSKDIIVYRFNDDWGEADLIEEFEKLTDDVTEVRKKSTQSAIWNALEGTLRRRQWVRGAVKKMKALKPVLEIIKALLSFLPSSD